MRASGGFPEKMLPGAGSVHPYCVVVVEYLVYVPRPGTYLLLALPR